MNTFYCKNQKDTNLKFHFNLLVIQKKICTFDINNIIVWLNFVKNDISFFFLKIFIIVWHLSSLLRRSFALLQKFVKFVNRMYTFVGLCGATIQFNFRNFLTNAKDRLNIKETIKIFNESGVVKKFRKFFNRTYNLVTVCIYE